MGPRHRLSDRLIVALDATTEAAALSLAKRLQGVVRIVKVGSVLFTACGPSVIQRLRRLGFLVMLDLKFFDIPSTVELSCRAATRHQVSLLTVHATGGPDMLAAAVQGARQEARRLGVTRPQILAVTVLTSVAAQAHQATRKALALAQIASHAGCDGIVASAQEARTLRKRFGARLKIACPGIRPAQAERDDQRRVVTPGQALALGADWLVVGRPITAARNPRAAAQQILHEMEARSAC